MDMPEWWETDHIAPIAMANQSPVAAGTVPGLSEEIEDTADAAMTLLRYPEEGYAVAVNNVLWVGENFWDL